MSLRHKGSPANVGARVHTSAFAVSDPEGLVYGTGLYVRAGSYFNHSCQPTAAISFLGRSLRVHAIRKLRCGEEAAISYTDVYQGRHTRQANLQANKGFTCACLRCASPPAADAPIDGWHCVNCGSGKGAVPPDASACIACGATWEGKESLELLTREGVRGVHTESACTYACDVALCGPGETATIRSDVPSLIDSDYYNR